MNKIIKYPLISSLVIALIIAIPYFINFRHSSFSSCSSDWGAFGSYFGGILSIASVMLLYITLQKQQVENHLNLFDASFSRRTKTLKALLNSNDGVIKPLAERIFNSFESYPFGADFLNEDARIKLSNLYIGKLGNEQNVAEIEYQYFKNSVNSIHSDQYLDSYMKNNYADELEQILNIEHYVIILCVMCYLDDKCLIKKLKEFRTFEHFQTGYSGIDVLKDLLFSYK